MKSYLIVVMMLVGVSNATADSRADAAATWIEAAVRGKTPKLAKPINLVFDSGKAFAATSACGKLRIATIQTAAELSTFTGCVQAAASQLAVDKLPAVPAKDLHSPGTRYLRSWFAKSFHLNLVIPAGQRMFVTSFSRPVPGAEGAGVAVMICVLVDAADQITTVYAYAGHWAYPV